MNEDLEDLSEEICNALIWPEDDYESSDYDDFLFSGANLYGGF